MRRGLGCLGQLGLCEDISGLLTGGGVDVEVLEEDLRVAGVGSAALVVVGALDVDCRNVILSFLSLFRIARCSINEDSK